MTIETVSTPHNEDLDKDDRLDKWRIAVWVLVLLLIGAITWILIAQGNTANRHASNEASQKFTLAQQVAAACAIKEQADDLGGLCQKAQQLVKEGPAGHTGVQGPPGDIGPQGPLGPKGETGDQGIQGLLGAQGLFGKPGDTGAAGAAGSPGEPGVIGPSGSAGADGVAGPAGVAGAAGSPGAIGTTGQSAFPFTFDFTTVTGKFTCNVTAPNVITVCTTTP